MTVRTGWLRYRGATEAQWETDPTVWGRRRLLVSEDTGRIKMSDGVHAWADLPYVDNVAVQDLIDGAPAALDTLNELAAALADDEDFAASVTTALAGKLPTAHATDAATHINLPYAPLRSNLPSSFLPAIGGSPILAWDDYRRSNRDLNGDTAPSGHVIVNAGSHDARILDNGAHLETVAPGAGSTFIEYELEVKPTTIAAEFVFTEGTTATQEGLIVASVYGQAIADGSVQPVITPTSWAMMKVEDSARDILEGDDFDTPLVADGVTRYALTMTINRATDTVSVTFPGGGAAEDVPITRHYTDPDLTAFWGTVASIQLNRGVTAPEHATNGDVWATAFAAAAGPSDPIIKTAAAADPPVPSTGNVDLYARTVAGRTMWRVLGKTGRSYSLQPALFSNAVALINPGGSTSLSTFGTNVTSAGTVSHVWSTTLGFYANFVTGSSAGNTAGTGHQVLRWLRGNAAGSNGFFFKARVCFPDASYGSGATGARVFVGLSANSMASTVAADDPGTGHVGFGYSTNRGDTNFLFTHAAGGAAATADTGIAFIAQHVYDMFLYCAPQGTTVYWRIDDLTAGTTAEGSTTSTLPGTTTEMRGGLQLATLDNAARNIGLLGVYTEADR